MVSIKNDDNELSAVESLVNQAYEAMKNKQVKTAIQLWEEVIKEDELNADAHAWLAACFGASINEANLMNKMIFNTKMKKELDKAFSLAPNSPTAHKVQGIRYLNAPPGFGGDVNKAINSFLSSIHFDKTDPDVHYYLGLAYQKTNQIDNAIHAFRTCLEKDNNHGQAKYELDKMG